MRHLRLGSLIAQSFLRSRARFTSAQALLSSCSLDDHMTLLLYKIINYAERKSDDTRVTPGISQRYQCIYAGRARQLGLSELLAIPAEFA